MKRAAFLLLLMFLAVQSAAFADGCFMPDERTWQERRERSLINEPEQKAVVFFSKGTEQLIISPSYEGPSTSFAWVVPVPARPKVEILKGAIFHELAELTMPEPPTDRISQSARTLSAAPGVVVLERKTVGAYDVSVLQATDPKALMNWLKVNKYHLPEKAVEPMRSYIKKGWTFVASRIKVPANSKGLRSGTLAPLRLTFKTKRPIYPMKLSAANPKPFTALIYLILPSSNIGGKPNVIPMRGWFSQKETLWAATASGYPWKRRGYPTLAKLYNGEMQIYPQHCYARPEDCTQDLVWTLPKR